MLKTLILRLLIMESGEHSQRYVIRHLQHCTFSDHNSHGIRSPLPHGRGEQHTSSLANLWPNVAGTADVRPRDSIVPCVFDPRSHYGDAAARYVSMLLVATSKHYLAHTLHHVSFCHSYTMSVLSAIWLDGMSGSHPCDNTCWLLYRPLPQATLSRNYFSINHVTQHCRRGPGGCT